MTDEQEKFESWCILELFGHQRVAGLVTEATIGGCSFIRVDVPAQPGRAAMTKFYSQGAVYCMTPVTETLARQAASQMQPRPVSRWDLPQLPERRGDEATDADEDRNEDPE